MQNRTAELVEQYRNANADLDNVMCVCVPTGKSDCKRCRTRIARNMARNFAEVVRLRTGETPSIYGKRDTQDLGYTPNALACVVIEGTGETLIEETLTGKWNNGVVYAEPYSSWLIAFYAVQS
jgi:hypothetical protein